MATETLETQRLLNFLDALRPPVHVIILYGDPSELDIILDSMRVEEFHSEAPHYAAESDLGSHLIQGVVNRWLLNRVGQDAFSDLMGFIETEERIRDSQQPRMVMCAYPLNHFVKLDMSIFVDILSIHDYVLFSRFMEGQNMVLEAMEEALDSALGLSGSEMIYRIAENWGVDRGQIARSLRQFMLVLREVLGVGADFLERFIFRRLYLKLRSSPQVARVGG